MNIPVHGLSLGSVRVAEWGLDAGVSGVCAELKLRRLPPFSTARPQHRAFGLKWQNNMSVGTKCYPTMSSVSSDKPLTYWCPYSTERAQHWSS